MADIVKAPVLVVGIAAVEVRILVVPATKHGCWDNPLHRRCPNNPKQDQQNES